ncbi:MAG: hypothetical protein ACOC1G_03135 [Phycisphaeraceae bacterium]
MRLLIDTLIAIMALGLLGGVLWMRSDDSELRERIDSVRGALDELRTTAAYHGALGHLSNSPAGYPVHMMPEWFAEAVPMNVLLPDAHPWIDLAPPGDSAIHPPDPVASHEGQAGFWYNPNAGVFRARVPAEGGTSRRLELYNRVNHAELAALPESEDADRTPQAYHPGDSFTTLASNYAPGGSVEGRASEPNGDAELVIEWVSGDPTQPPATIHELPERWTVPEKPEEQAAAADLDTPSARGDPPTGAKSKGDANHGADPGSDGSAKETPHARSTGDASSEAQSKAESESEAEAEPHTTRRRTLGDLSPDADAP